MTKCPYLGKGGKNQKINATFHSSTLKVLEKKVVLFFLFSAPVPRYCHFLKSMSMGQMTKWPYLGKGGKNQKSKVTFPSPTLKVQEKKVPYFPHILLLGRDMATFILKTFLFNSYTCVRKARNSDLFLDKNIHFLFFLVTLE